jgi:transketolase
VPRLVVEAASPLGWERYAGPGGAVIGVGSFGTSAPGNVVYEKFGFSVDHLVEVALRLVGARTGPG